MTTITPRELRHRETWRFGAYGFGVEIGWMADPGDGLADAWAIIDDQRFGPFGSEAEAVLAAIALQGPPAGADRRPGQRRRRGDRRLNEQAGCAQSCRWFAAATRPAGPRAADAGTSPYSGKIAAPCQMAARAADRLVQRWSGASRQADRRRSMSRDRAKANEQFGVVPCSQKVPA